MTTAEAPAATDGDVVVVGGGQAALAAGYYLQRAQRLNGTDSPSFALLDAGPGPGGAWTDGWDTLQLFSPAGFSSLPGWPMPAWARKREPGGRACAATSPTTRTATCCASTARPRPHRHRDA